MSLKAVNGVEQQPVESGRVSSNDMRQHVTQELIKKIRQYESGKEGRLNSIFPGTLRLWLDHCHNLGKHLYMIWTVSQILLSLCSLVMNFLLT